LPGRQVTAYNPQPRRPTARLTKQRTDSVGDALAAAALTPALLILAALLTTTAAIVAAPTKHPQNPTRDDSNV
jgi:hypothetical protein